MVRIRTKHTCTMRDLHSHAPDRRIYDMYPQISSDMQIHECKELPTRLADMDDHLHAFIVRDSNDGLVNQSLVPQRPPERVTIRVCLCSVGITCRSNPLVYICMRVKLTILPFMQHTISGPISCWCLFSTPHIFQTNHVQHLTHTPTKSVQQSFVATLSSVN